MKTMKRLVIPALLAIAASPIFFSAPLAVSLTGCRSVQVGTNTVQELDPLASSTITGVIAVALPYAVQRDTNAIPYLRLVAGVFQDAADGGNYDPAQIKSAMDNISIKEIRGTPGDSVAQGIFAMYKGFFASTVGGQIDAAVSGPWLRQILSSAAQGINAGLPPP